MKQTNPIPASEAISRYTIVLPEQMHRQLKVLAAMKGVSMRELILLWIEQGIAQSDTSNDQLFG